jgi:hypothetical protein
VARGRKRKSVPRQPNGQPKRSAAEQAREARSVGIAARVRVHDLKPAEAERQESGHALGRLFVAGHLGPSVAENGPGRGRLRFDAGEEYERICRRYDQAMGARRVRSTSDFDAPGYDASEGTDRAYVKWCRQAVRAHEASREALNAADADAEKMLNLAIRGVVIEPGGIMFPPLVKGLDALVALYRVDEWQGKGRAA